MAETTATSSTTTPQSTPRSTTAKKAATKRSTTAKKAATTRTRKQGAGARRTAGRKAETRAAQAERRAEARAIEARNGLGQAVDTVEKVVLTGVGAVLVARDNVIGTVDELRGSYSTQAKVERQLSRFERRGVTARNRVERDLKRTRTRVERELRQRRTRAERTVRQNRTRLEREVRKQAKPVADQAGLVGARVENAVQGGILAGATLATKVQEQVAKVA